MTPCRLRRRLRHAARSVSAYFLATRQRSYSFLAGATLVLLTGCHGPLSALDPMGPAAAAIATLWWVMFSAAAALFSLVIGLLAWAYCKPGYGTRTSARTWLLHAGVLMPSVVLAALAGYALLLGERLAAHADADMIQVQAIATQWHWQFHYPQLDAAPATAALHIPVARTVEVTVISNDVIHSFWVPRLAGKIDVIPGHNNRIRLRAEQPGTYEGVCAEFCGFGHTGMRFQVIAHTADRYRDAVLKAAP